MAGNDDIYSYSRKHVMHAHRSRIEGNAEGLVLVVFTTPPSAVARDALEKSFERLGFGGAPCTYADLSGLGPDDVFDVVEGIDPVALVATDAAAAQGYADAIRHTFPLMRELRLFGREARAFDNLNGMLSTPADKQRVWHLLKSMTPGGPQ